MNSKLPNWLSNISKISFLLLAIYGVGLITLQLLQDRSVWGDESFITCNILFKSYKDFLAPLAYNQAAPFLFLSFEKLLVSTLGVTDLHFRILPFLATLGTIPLLGKIGQFLFKETYYAGLAIALLLLSPCVIYYSSEIKPYVIELFYSCLLVYLALVKNNRSYALLIAGCIGIFLANASIIILFCIALLIIYEYFTKTNEHSVVTLVCLASWLFSVCIFYYFFVHDNPTALAMDHWWMRHGGFLFSEFYLPNYTEILYRILYIFGSESGFVYQDFIAVNNILTYGILYFGGLFILGLVTILLEKETKLICLCILPLLIHLAFNIFRLYPIEQRINLYQFPLIILLILIGQHRIINFLKQYNASHWSKIIPVIFLGFIAFFMKSEFPKSRDNTKAALNYLVEINAKEPTTNITLISFATMVKHYGAQEKYAALIKSAKLHPIRTKFNATNELKGKHWIYLAQEAKEEMVAELTTRYQVTQSIDSLSLYLVDFE